MFLEGTLVRAALSSVLSIDEGVVLLAILVGMRKGHLDIVALQMDNGVQRVVGHAVFQQIFQSMTRENTTTIVHDGQTRVQIGVVAQHVLHNVVLELIVLEQRVVGFKVDVRAVLVLRLLCRV